MWFATFIALAFAGQLVQAQYIPVEYVENIQDIDAWQARIVSGWAAQPGQHPHQVSLRMVDINGGVLGCGGNIVHREWVLSAAHCIASFITIVVRAGLVQMTRPEMMLESTEYYVYPTFDVNNPFVVQPNDIAVLKLPRPLQYSNSLRSIRLQPSSQAYRNYDEEIVYASGFGRTWTNGLQSEHLMWVYLRGVSNAACASLFGTQLVTDNTICARFFNVTSQSICQGDSGGPLVHVSTDGEPILVGLSSFVAGDPFGCHSGIPGAFVRPGPFHGWLTSVTGLDFDNLIEEDETTTSPTTTTSSPSTLPTVTITESPSTLPTVTITVPTVPTTVNITESPTTLPTVTITIPPVPTTVNTTESPTALPTVTITEPTVSTTVNITESPSTLPPTTFPPINTTTTIVPTSTTALPPTIPEEDEDKEEEEVDIDDPELEDILKRLEVKVRVKVRFSKYLKKRNETKTNE